MIGGCLVLAVVMGAGTVPIPDSVSRFPDPSYWPGMGAQQVRMMLAAVQADAGLEMRSAGPGPHQLMARWRAGSLNAAERVAVLLGGPAFHDPVLLPAYAEALRSPTLRERQAAAVGLAWLLGEPSPDPRAVAAQPDTVENLAVVAERVARACRRRTLLGVWADSYLAASGLPHRPGMTLGRRPEECLRAIAAIAQPDDLDELVALWPLIAERHQQYALVPTFAIVTLRRFEPAPPPGSRVTQGGWLTEAGAQAVDGFVRRLCNTPDGEALVRAAVARLAGVPESGLDTPAPWLAVLRLRLPSMWAVPLERLTAFGAPAVHFDRSNPAAKRNEAAVRRVRSLFALTN